MVPLFLAWNFLEWFLKGLPFFDFYLFPFNFLVLTIFEDFLYYFSYSFFSLSVFVYIKNSLPVNVNKSALIFALILFLVGSAPISIYQLSPILLPIASDFKEFTPGLYVVNLIFSVLSVLVTGFLVSHAFEKFYKK
jgi:hypothetical protein